MGWTYDRGKVESQLTEFGTFIDHARNDEPAGLTDIFGRPFQHPAASEPDVQPVVQQNTQVNLYLLQAAQLYEAGLINQNVYNGITQNIYT